MRNEAAPLSSSSDRPSLLDPTIVEGNPPYGAIATFYAELGQAAELKQLKDLFPDAATAAALASTEEGAPATAEAPQRRSPDNSAELKVLYKMEGGKLIGLLRAVKDASGDGGIVYDIGVHPAHRKAGLGTSLIEELQKREPLTHWRGYPFRVMPDLDRLLNSLRTLYGVSLVLGFREVALGAYALLFTARSGLSLGKICVLSVLLGALVLIGIRLFWAVGVIRRFVLRRVFALTQPSEPVQPRGGRLRRRRRRLASPRRLMLVLVCYPVLFFHAVLFFFLGSTFRAIVNSSAATHATEFIALYSALLLTNAAWLHGLRPLNSDPLQPITSRDLPFETIWARNNLVFGIFGLLLLAASQAAGGAAFALAAAAILFVINSVIDYCYTSEAYAWGDAYSGG